MNGDFNSLIALWSHISRSNSKLSDDKGKHTFEIARVKKWVIASLSS